MRNVYRFLIRKPPRKRDLALDGRIILRWMQWINWLQMRFTDAILGPMKTVNLLTG
jgi:hypothetical protein